MQLRSWGILALAVALCSFVAPSPAHSQGATTGSIRGTVISTEGAPVAGAQVMATNSETGLSRGVLSDAQGRYAILLLPSGVYTLRVQHLGYAPFVAEDVRVQVGEATPLNATVAPRAVALEGVTVSAERTRADVARGGVAQTVSTQQVENLPVAGRDFTDFLNLSPLVSPQPQVGTGGQFSIGGARTSGTNVQIDGADANNAFFGENRDSSRTSDS